VIETKKNKKTTTPEMRRRIILNLLKKRDSATTREILEECTASEITIRRDLSELEEKGLLIRTHGGAIKKTTTDHLFGYNHKMNRNRENKEYICKIASKYINANDIIFIDCGPTLSFLPKYISRTESLTVVTNSLPVVSDLIHFNNIRLILIGGEVVNGRKAICGHSAERSILQYHANKAFIGADGISLSKGLTSYDEKQASVTLKMAENADEVFLLCHSSKIEKYSFMSFAPVSVLNHIITDKNLDNRLIVKYRNNNVNLINN
jgi:DeoR family transcriptional regulator, fructose operon transcriptional repressor